MSTKQSTSGLALKNLVRATRDLVNADSDVIMPKHTVGIITWCGESFLELQLKDSAGEVRYINALYEEVEFVYSETDTIPSQK